jgi:hypothetical protein
MFGQAELDRLRQHKRLLVLQSEAHRLTLVADLQRLRSLEFWQNETTQTARRHPLLTAALAVGAGIVAIKAVRQPGSLLGLVSKLGGAGSALLSAWKMFGPK